MYAPGQIIYDLDKEQPVKIEDNWDAGCYPKRHTHFIRPTGRFWHSIEEYVVASPHSVAEAKELLRKQAVAKDSDGSLLKG